MEHAVDEIEIVENKSGLELSPGTLPKVLRYIGASTLGLSALSFAVNRAGELDSIGRFYSFLAFTAVLAVCGFVCALRLKEDKGARTFLGISLVFIPALFLQLGGLVYYLANGIPKNLPKIFILSAPSTTSVMIALATSVPLALIIAFGGFSALVRSRAKSLTILFSIMVGALLIPTRVVDEVSLIILVLGVAMAAMANSFNRKDARFETFEGKAALGVLSLPLLLLVSRTLFLYGATSLFGAALCVVVGVFLWNFKTKKTDGYAPVSQLWALFFYSAAWECFASALTFEPSGLVYMSGLADALNVIYVPLITLPIAAGLYFFSAGMGRSERGVVRAAAYIATLPMTYHVIASGNTYITVVGLIIGSGVISGAFLRKDRHLLSSGTLLLGSVLAMNLHYALDLYHYNPWLALGATGGSIVLASSLLERNMAAIIAKAERVRHELGAWE